MSDITAAEARTKRFNVTVSIMIAIVSALVGILAYLQSDAGARDDAANRDTKRYSTEALGRKISGNARVNYDNGRAYQQWYELDLLMSAAEARDDLAAAARYRKVRDSVASLSPMLQPPYFDPAQEGAQPDFAKYESDTYLVEVTRLMENFTAASAVKDAWDSKSNTYIVHLTLLAVSLFLFGLATTIGNTFTRVIFAGLGTVITIFAVGWAAITWAQPVTDLRQQGNAIDAYARGVGLANQSQWDGAVAAFNEALQAAPDYRNAIVARADAYESQEKFDLAVADYEKAVAMGDTSTGVGGNLAWDYYLLGRFDDAARMNRTVLETHADELWVQYDLALSLLAAGKIDEAKQEYQKGMDMAAKQVADAKAAGAEPPSFLWWGLDDAASSLDGLLDTLDTGEGMPAKDKIQNQEAVKATGAEMIARIRSYAVALEYTGAPPAGALTAKISEFTFSAPDPDAPAEEEAAEGEDEEVAEGEDEGGEAALIEGDSFPAGTKEVLVSFDYEGMQDGQEVIFKVYIDDEEDPSWRFVGPWDLGASGTAEKPLSLSYSDVFVLSPGLYEVDMFVGGHLAQRGWFSIEE